MSARRPPRVARALLRRIVPAQARDEIASDLADLWHDRCASHGRRAADRWYWGQTLRAMAPSVLRMPGSAQEDRGERILPGLRKDLGFAATQVRKHPAVASVVVVTLGIGIGATTAIFSVVHAVLLESLPYESPHDLMMVTSESGGSSLPRFLSGPDLVDLTERASTLAGTAALLETTVGPMTEVERPEHVLTTPVTWNLFDLLGVPVALGRSFARDDAMPAPDDATLPPPTTAIISHAFWQRSFGGDPGVVGRTVHVWGGATEIVGVLPRDFELALPPELNIPADGDIWRAVRSDISGWSREGGGLRVIARLRDGASVGQARDEVAEVATELRRLHPHHGAEGTRFRIAPLVESVAAPLRSPLLVLLCAVALVLLIACANVANLLLARGAARESEMAVRSSLGAGTGRLLRQLLTESAVLAALGTALGVAIARVGVAFLHAIRPDDLHRLEAVRLDLPVLLFTVLVGVAVTLLAGFLPARNTARAGRFDRLTNRGHTGRGGRLRDGLVVGQMALSVVLLVGAGLLIRTFGALQGMELGFEPARVLTVTATQSSRPAEERRAYEEELIRAAQGVPGVAAAGIVFPLPMNGVYDRSAEYAMEGRRDDPTAWTTAYFRTVSPGYFETMGLELRRGRGFVRADEAPGVPTVVLDERLAQREFGDRDPVGRTLWVRGMAADTLRAEVVGVVEYAPQWDHRDTRPTMYFPRVFYQSHEVSLVARTHGEPGVVAGRLVEAIRAVDPRFPSDLVPMSAYVGERLARSRFLLILMQIFGVTALGLSAIGLYGVLAYSVRQRTRELGLRLALGAAGPSLTGRVVLRGLRLAAIGIGIGVWGALLLGRGLRAQLFGVDPADPLTLTAAIGVVLVVAVVASLVPAARAARVDPAVALHES